MLLKRVSFVLIALALLLAVGCDMAAHEKKELKDADGFLTISIGHR